MLNAQTNFASTEFSLLTHCEWRNVSTDANVTNDGGQIVSGSLIALITLFYHFISLLTGLSHSQVRAFRHTSTLAGQFPGVMAA